MAGRAGDLAIARLRGGPDRRFEMQRKDHIDGPYAVPAPPEFGLVVERVVVVIDRLAGGREALAARGIPTHKLIMVLSRILGAAEAKEARRYITEAGYAILDGCIMERVSYRTAQDLGRAITETDYDTLNAAAREIIDALVQIIQQKAAA